MKLKLFYLKYNIFRCFDRRGRNPVMAVFWFWLSGSVSGVMITGLVYITCYSTHKQLIL